jgi:hypothetical protein
MQSTKNIIHNSLPYINQTSHPHIQTKWYQMPASPRTDYFHIRKYLSLQNLYRYRSWPPFVIKFLFFSIAFLTKLLLDTHVPLLFVCLTWEMEFYDFQGKNCVDRINYFTKPCEFVIIQMLHTFKLAFKFKVSLPLRSTFLASFKEPR